MNLRFFANLYRKLESHILSNLKKGKLSEKQADAVAVKLDIFGVFLVTQAWFALKQGVWSFWPSLSLFIISIVFCVILWTTAFIMKGYRNV